MKTLIRIGIILLAALAVTGVTYAVSQSAWATAQFAAGGERGEGRPGGEFDPSTALTSAAATLGVESEALVAALGDMPSDYAQAAQTLGLPEANVRAAVEASLAAGFGERPGGRGEGGEHGGGGNLFAFAAFIRILLPMALMIGAVTLIRAVAARLQRRRALATPAASAN